MTLNKEKTEYMIISSRQRLAEIDDGPNISLDGINMKRVKQAKTLRIVIDEQLLWKNQTDEMTTKVSRRISMLRRMKAIVRKKL